MSEITLSLKNGVTITDEKFCGHHCVNNAICWCGDKLIVAPKVMAEHTEKGNPVVCCVDHGHAAFMFKDLKGGYQDNPNDPPAQPVKVISGDQERINKLELAINKFQYNPTTENKFALFALANTK